MLQLGGDQNAPAAGATLARASWSTRLVRSLLLRRLCRCGETGPMLMVERWGCRSVTEEIPGHSMGDLHYARSIKPERRRQLVSGVACA